MNAARKIDPGFGPEFGSRTLTAEDAGTFMGRVYGWMGFGLVLTGVVAAFVAASARIQQAIFGTPLFFGLLIAQLLMVVVFSRTLRKVSFGTAAAMFVSYCALSGLTFSIYFLLYTKTSIALTFYVTGGMFAAMSAFGTMTKKDLSGWGRALFMALVGLILVGVINLFFGSPLISYVTSAIAVFVFTGLTAYDTQKIRRWASAGDQRLALAGALELYLDFINLFIALLRLFGRRR
jgi:hypothetical protein